MKKLLLFVAVAAQALTAQAPDKAKLDAYFNALETSGKWRGSVMLSQNGQPVYTRNVGMANEQAGQKITDASKFRIGSISKVFTSAMILKATEEKKLQLTDKLDKYYPTVPNAGKITITDLLNHHSGIHNFTDDEAYLTYNTKPKTHEEMVALITKGGSDFEPGSKADYSNSNYVLLTYILEKVYKKPYKDLLQEKIVKPLGLKNTYYGGKTNPAANEVMSYKFEGSWAPEPETDMSIPAGAGAVVSNVNDISRFIEALFAGKVISAASLEQMKTIKDGYGLGLFTIPFNEKTSYGHTGGIDGFTSMLGYFPNEKVTVAMTSNGANFNGNDIAIAMLSAAFNQPFEIPQFSNYTPNPQELDLLVGTYAAPGAPMKIMITRKDATLIAQATGQQSFPLDAVALNRFEFKMAGIKLDFKPEAKQMILKQGGGEFTFTKE